MIQPYDAMKEIMQMKVVVMKAPCITDVPLLVVSFVSVLVLFSLSLSSVTRFFISSVKSKGVLANVFPSVNNA